MSMMKPSLQLKLGQTLTMTPQLQQAIRLLQMPALELQAHIREQLESNVMLEPVDEYEATGSFEALEPHPMPEEKRVDAQAARRLPERLAALILERHQEAGGGAFGLGGSQTAVAEELGTVREVVVRMLGELRRAGLIRPAGRGRLEVANLTALRRLAGAAPQRATGSAMR